MRVRLLSGPTRVGRYTWGYGPSSDPARQHLGRPDIVAALDAREHVGPFRLERGFLAEIDAEVEQVLAVRVLQIFPVADPGGAARAR